MEDQKNNLEQYEQQKTLLFKIRDEKLKPSPMIGARIRATYKNIDECRNEIKRIDTLMNDYLETSTKKSNQFIHYLRNVDEGKKYFREKEAKREKEISDDAVNFSSHSGLIGK